MTDTLWYTNMANAMKQREKCLNAIARWQADLADAEAEIQRLRGTEKIATSEHLIPAGLPEFTETNNQ